MRRSVILSLCVVLVAAAGAQADMMYGSGAFDDYTCHYTRTTVGVPAGYGGTDTVYLDRIDVSVDYFPLGAPKNTPLNTVSGTWTASDGYMNCMNGSASSFTAYLGNCNLTANFQYGLSYVNFDTVANASYSGDGGNSWTWEQDDGYWDKGTNEWVEVWKDNAWYYSSVTADWSTSTNPLYTNNMLAQFWVQPGAQLSFNGTWDFEGTTFSGGLTTVPEPSTLALIGMGLVGLLCYAWRKRR